MKELFISPVAIDFGAKNTGVYKALYKADSKSSNIEKKGFVYTLDSKNYTLLMKDRTSKRHQKRGYDRRQMAKRLFKLIWEKHLKLPWDEDISKVVGFLMNRRGFSFIEEQYDPEILKAFPTVLEKLPQEIQNLFKKFLSDSDYIDFSNFIYELSKNEEECKNVYREISKIINEHQKEKSYVTKLKALKEKCSEIASKKELKEQKSLKKVPLEIREKWSNEGITEFENTLNRKGNIDIDEILENVNVEKSKKILEQIPEFKKEEEEIKNSIWDFNPAKFNFKKANFEIEDVNKKDKQSAYKNHLHHLVFAIYKIHNEIISGGIHRSKYFKEIRDVLKRKDHTHKYLESFCEKLQGDKFSSLNKDNLVNLIGNRSIFLSLRCYSLCLKCFNVI